VVTGGPGSARARLRLATVVLLTLLALLWAVLGLRLFVAPPAMMASSFASLVGLFYLIDALAYGLSARWVAVQKRWGHIVAIAVVAANVVLGVTAHMTWLEWALLAPNVVVLLLLVPTVPRRVTVPRPR
jgi:cytochrome c oxidase subunit IV